MHEELLPLFPLSLVLLPQNIVPLHIFEERYREMIGEALENQTEFGIVLAANDGILNVGCTATVERVLRRYDDGRLDIIGLGRRRFRIEELDQERAFLRAKVEFFEDVEEFASEELQTKAREVHDRFEASADLPTQGGALSYMLSQSVRDVEVRQQLLMSRSESERLRLLIDFLPKQRERETYVVHMKEVAPRNGHGKHGPKEAEAGEA
ncbi:MAG: LON peptidase substrate-binding domain-containing protein [Acidobacteria bacterium]|nr:LON peptidase substrate-binding domain-containing protein [Acidobacteriota bacterium]